MFDPKQFTPAANGPPAAATPPMPHVPIQSAHLLDRLSIVFKHRRLGLAVFGVTVGLMMAQAYATIPLYRAKAQILIQDERSTTVTSLAGSDPSFWQDPEPYYNTQYRILHGRGLGRRVVKRLELQNVPEFNGTMAGSRGPLSFVRSLRAMVTGGVRRAYSAVASRGEKPEVEAPAPDESAQEAALVGAFLSRVRVEPQRGTRLVDVYFDAADPAFAAKAVDALAEEYVQQNLELKLGTVQTSLTWLEDELKRQQQKITKSETALTDYRSQQNAPSLDSRQNIVVARLNQLNDTVTSARTNRVQKESLFRQVERLNPKSANVDSFPAVAQSTAVLEARGRLSSLEQQKASLTGRYGPQHPEMLKLETQIENARRQIRVEAAKAIEQLRSEYLAAAAQERSLTSSLEEQKQAALDLDKKSAAYSILERQAESDRKVYESLLQQQKELSVIRNSRANNVQVMDHAEVPGAPSTPDLRREWMMALLLGLGLAICLAFGVEYLDDTVKTPDDVTRRLKLPLLGLVPAARGKDAPLLTGTVPHDFGEAFRSLRTSLVFTSGSETTADHRHHEQSAARGQDDDGLQPRGGARAGRRPGAVDRRGHAAPEPAQDDGAAERDRAVAPARRPGPRPRCRAAHERAEPLRDYRGPDAAQPVGAAVLGSAEGVPAESRVRPVRLGRPGHAPGPRRHRRGHRRALGDGNRVRDRIRDDPSGPRRARARDAADQPTQHHRRRPESRGLRRQ